MILRAFVAASTLGIAAGLCGCGSTAPTGKQYTGATVTGTVVERGKPLKFKPNEEVSVGFYAIDGPDAEKASFGAPVKPEDGTFTMSGPSGTGIPAGKYKITLSSQVYGDGNDRFQQQFASDGSAQMIADVGAEPGQNFVVDVAARKTVKK